MCYASYNKKNVQFTCSLFQGRNILVTLMNLLVPKENLHNSPVSQLFCPWWWAAWKMHISLWVRTTNCWLYSNISQILLLHKTWGNYKNLTLWNPWCMLLICQKTQYGYEEHGLEYITFYVQKHIAPVMLCSGPSQVCDKPLGGPAFVRLTYYVKLDDRHCSSWWVGTVGY